MGNTVEKKGKNEARRLAGILLKGQKKCRCYLLTQMQCSGPHY